jgi:hypothetical protein
VKNTYKVGDRVVATKDVPSGYWWKPGMEGTVSMTRPDDDWTEVTFDGHVGLGIVSTGHMHYIRPLVSKPTLADALTFKPSTRRVLAHLEKHGSITVLEALAAYGVTRIAPAIHDLREGGYDIETVSKKDGGGHNYTRYVLNQAA